MNNLFRNIALGFFLILSLKVYSQELLITADSEINSVSINDDGRIHLLSEGKICVYEGTQIVDECLKIDFEVDKIIPVKDGLYIMVHDNFITIVNEDNLVHTDTLPDIVTASVAHGSQLFLGTAGSGLFSFDIDSHLKKFVGYENEFINALAISKGLLIVALNHGISSYHLTTELKNSVDSPTLINHLVVLSDDTFVAFSESGHLYKMDVSLSTLKRKDLKMKGITDFSESLNSIFFLSDSGCYHLDKNLNHKLIVNGQFDHMLSHGNNLIFSKGNTLLLHDLTVYSIPFQDRIFSVFSENDSTLWVGSLNKIYRVVNGVTVESIPIPSTLSNVFVSALVVDQFHIYAGTMGDGLFVFNRRYGTIEKHIHYEEANNRNNIIQLKLHSNRLWVAYLTGLMVLNSNDLQIEQDFDELLKSNYLYSVAPVSLNEFYLGTSTQGVIHYKEGEVNQFLDSLSFYSVEIGLGGVIASSEKKGVYLIRDNNSKKLPVPSHTYQSILEVDSILVMCAKNHVSVFMNGQNIPISIGSLINVQLNAITQDTNGIYIGFENGILKISKNRLKALSEMGIHLNLPKLFDTRLLNSKRDFKYDENVFSFTFHPNTYYNIASATYKFRLLGLDTAWQLTQQNNANYYNLGHGDYVFEVSSGFDNHFVPNKIQRFPFIIEKPFWKEWWFIGLIVSFCIMVVFLYIRARERNLIKSEHQKQEKMRFELEQLKNQIDPHFLFNSFNSLIGQIEENPTSAIASTQELSDFFRNMLQFEKSELISLENELKLARQYFKIHQIRFENLIELKVEIQAKDDDKVIPLSLQFLIENAIKHNIINQQTPLSISVTKNEEYLVVSNTLTRKGDEENSTHTGLENLKSRYSFFTKKPVIIEETDGMFNVRIPIIHG